MPLTSVNSTGIKDDAIVNADIKSDAAIALSKLASDPSNASNIVSGTLPDARIGDDSIVEAKLDIHNSPSGTDKVLGYTSNGMEWIVSAAGATGGGTNKIFWENEQTIDYNYTVTNNHNAMSAGPITIAATGNGDGSAVVVTVGDGETWTIV